jgi:hypothetical protein
MKCVSCDFQLGQRLESRKEGASRTSGYFDNKANAIERGK